MSKFIIAIAVAAVMFVLQSRLIRATDRKVLQLIPVFLARRGVYNRARDVYTGQSGNGRGIFQLGLCLDHIRGDHCRADWRRRSLALRKGMKNAWTAAAVRRYIYVMDISEKDCIRKYERADSHGKAEIRAELLQEEPEI